MFKIKLLSTCIFHLWDKQINIKFKVHTIAGVRNKQKSNATTLYKRGPFKYVPIKQIKIHQWKHLCCTWVRKSMCVVSIVECKISIAINLFSFMVLWLRNFSLYWYSLSSVKSIIQKSSAIDTASGVLVRCWGYQKITEWENFK